MASRPGCFLDLDSLEVGVEKGCPNELGTDQTHGSSSSSSTSSSTSSNELTFANWKAQLALWAVITAQLVLGNDILAMPARTRELLLSPGYVAVNQDPLAVPGRLLRVGDRNNAEIWAKPLGAFNGFACVLWYRNQTLAFHRRSRNRLHEGSIQLDFEDLGVSTAPQHDNPNPLVFEAERILHPTPCL